MRVYAARESMVILPSENQIREFDAKLLLACVLAERGFDAIVGARHDIHNHIARFPRSIYVAKDFRKPSERILNIIAGLGHRILAWDEEGLVQPLPALYYERRYTLPAIQKVSEVFAWGPANERLMLGSPSWPGFPIHRTGNPRLDLLRPELRAFHATKVDSLRSSLGRFVVFNSNFASFNPAIASVAPVMANNGKTVIPYLAWRHELFEQWKLLLPRIAKSMPNVTLVVRPHPSESHDLWQSIAQDVPNMEVLYSGSAIPWILASDVLLHSGCTTGVEAFFLGKPALSLRPDAPIPLEQDLPDSLSEIATSGEALIAALQKRLGSKNDFSPTSQQYNIANDAAFARLGPLASDRIADVLEQIAGQQHVNPRTTSALLKAWLRQFEKRLTALSPKHKTSEAMNRLRYPGLSLFEVTNKIACLRSVLSRFDGIQVQQVTNQIYQISRNPQ